MQVIAQYSKPEEAYLALSVLEHNGIEAEIRDANIISVNWFYSNAVGGVKLAVPDDELENAKAILDLRNRQAGFIACPKCGSTHNRARDLSPLSALLMILFGIPIPVGKQEVFDCLECNHAFKP